MVRNLLSLLSPPAIVVVVTVLSLFVSIKNNNGLLVEGFSTKTQISRHMTTTTSMGRRIDSFLLMSSTSLPNPNLNNKDGVDECIIVEEDPTSPAKEFGSPLNDATKDFNRQLIMKIKETIFDTFYPQSINIERNYARFYALETIARMPYFSYLSVLHLFETLGHWRRAQYMKIHFSESWNELHHLLIMEELGNAPPASTNTNTNTENTAATTTTDDNKKIITFLDRFIAQHIAVSYYWLVVALYLANPNFAYNLNQAVEEEAYSTYDQFLNRYEQYLKKQPAPKIAEQYYLGDDHYLYDNMHWNSESYIDPTLPLSSLQQQIHDEKQQQQQQEQQIEPCIINESDIQRRRPKIDNLYDVFVAIRDDEMEHAKTMAFMQQNSETS